MQQRDIIKDQIEQVGRVLGKIIATYFDLKLKGDINLAFAETKKQFQEQLDIDFAELAKLDEDAFKQFFESRNFSSAQLDQIAELLYDHAINSSENDPHSALAKVKSAKRFLDLAGHVSETYSIERAQQATKIDQLIEGLSL